MKSKQVGYSIRFDLYPEFLVRGDGAGCVAPHFLGGFRTEKLVGMFVYYVDYNLTYGFLNHVDCRDYSEVWARHNMPPYASYEDNFLYVTATYKDSDAIVRNTEVVMQRLGWV